MEDVIESEMHKIHLENSDEEHNASEDASTPTLVIKNEIVPNSINRCSYCCKTFTHRGSLKWHIQTCANKDRKHPPYTCNYCCENFSRKWNLIRHAEICGPTKKQRSSEGFKKKFLKRSKNYSDYENRCNYCRKTFRLKWSLERHVKTCRNKNKKRIVSDDVSCTTVGIKNEMIMKNIEFIDLEHNYYSELLKQKGNFTWDIETGENSEDDPDYEEASVECIIIESQNNNDEEYLCDHCSRTFRQKWNLERHVKICGNKDYERTMNVSEEETIKFEEKISTSDVEYLCDYCNKTFHLKWNFTRHINSCRNKDKDYIASEETTIKSKKKIRAEENSDVEHGCNYCGKIFRLKWNLARHVETCRNKNKETAVSKEVAISLKKKIPRKKRSDVEYRCEYCDKIFQLRWKLNGHVKKCSTRKHTFDFKRKCSICGVNATSTLILHDHYQTNHKIDLSEKELQFQTLADFQSWKDEFEEDTTSQFIKPRSPYEIKGGIQFIKYICHRSGSFKPKGNNVRRVKRTGSNKIGSYCPARIFVYVTTENVTAKYIDTHIGHEMEMRRLLLSNLEKNKIAQKLRSNIPRRVILNEIRESVDTNNQLRRVDLLTRHDIRNIEIAYSKHKKNVAKDSCAQSLSDTVEPQEEVVEEYPPLEDDDPFVIEVDDYQYKMLQKYGEDYNSSDESVDCDISTQTSLTDVTEQQSAVLREVSRKSDESLEDRKRGILETVITACNMADNSEQVEAIEKLIAPLLRIVKCIERSKNTSMPSKDVEATNKKMVLYKNKQVNLKRN